MTEQDSNWQGNEQLVRTAAIEWIWNASDEEIIAAVAQVPFRRKKNRDKAIESILATRREIIEHADYQRGA